MKSRNYSKLEKKQDLKNKSRCFVIKITRVRLEHSTLIRLGLAMGPASNPSHHTDGTVVVQKWHSGTNLSTKQEVLN